MSTALKSTGSTIQRPRLPSLELQELFDRIEAAALDEKDLHSYQEMAIEWCMAHPRGALWIDMGLGKTIIMLTFLYRMIRLGKMRRALIVAPLRVARNTWPKEIKSWKHTAGLPFQLLRPEDDHPRLLDAYQDGYRSARSLGASPAAAAGAGQRQETAVRADLFHEFVRDRSPIHIINEGAVPALVEHLGEKWFYETVVWDEASRLRDWKSVVFESTKYVSGRFRRFHELTATPATQSYEALFSQFFLLDYGERLGKFITHYRKEHFSPHPYVKNVWEFKEETKDALLEKIADLTLVMREEDYLPRDKPIFAPAVISLSKKEMADYRAFEATSILTTEAGHDIEAMNAASLWGKLLQYASGTVYDTKIEETDEEDVFNKVKTVHPIHDHKMEWLKDVAQDIQSPLLVVYWFKATKVRLKKQFPKMVFLDRQGSQEDDWNAGKIKMLAVHPQGAGHGLNLQKGPGHHITLFDMFPSLELFRQIIGRLARQGQKNLVKVLVPLMAGTIDEDLWADLMALDREYSHMRKRLLEIKARAKLDEAEGL